jgi:hypothetical protein
MKPGLSFNVKEILHALSGAKLTKRDMLNIEGAGAAILKNGMRMRVAVDTSATKNSIDSHYDPAEQTESRVVDEVGPETLYAPNIEYGRQDQPNYPIQPFVRPTVAEDEGKVHSAISNAFKDRVNQWPR